MKTFTFTSAVFIFLSLMTFIHNNVSINDSISSERQVQLYKFYYIVHDSKIAKFSGIRELRSLKDAEAELANVTSGMNGYTKRVEGPFTTTSDASEHMKSSKAQWKASGHEIGAL